MKNILIIQQKMIGDVLLSSILCEALKKKHPTASIHYLVYPNTTPVIENNPFIDHIVTFKKEYKESKKSFFKFLKSIRNQNYDLVIDAYGKTESNLITLFSKASETISYHKWYTQFFYSKTITRKSICYTNAGNALENRLRLIFEEKKIASNIYQPKIFLTNEELSNTEIRLIKHGIQKDKPLIMISVLGSSQNKSLPDSYMAKIIDLVVLKTKGNILFNYIPNQEKQAKEIYNLTKPETKKHIHFDFFGKGLREFLSILGHCDMLIGNEGGAVNMAKALDIKTFTIFSPWIKKEAWNMFEDGKKHDSVHLADFEPELFNGDSYKHLKEKSSELYMQLTPERINSRLVQYLEKNTLGYVN